jgi:bifunctional UDP-N-acetylglucosamine pyrophosphorylase/glucosamine-1-phosphate N-acetyltransferase/UDP-N-acetylglucosamine pyrophosphorylase
MMNSIGRHGSPSTSIIPFRLRRDMNPPLAVVMAAGKGTRMKSELPKVLVPVLGRPMLEYVIDSLRAAGIAKIIVVVGYRAEDVKRTVGGSPDVAFALQAEQRGTGHAVMCAREHFANHDSAVVVVAGDSPLMQTTSIKKLLAEYERSRPACILGTAHKENPHGLGRIVRDAAGKFTGIVEEKDATPEQRQITEVNLSTYVFHGPDLLGALEGIRSDNAQGEYYVTDCPGVLLAEGKDVRALAVLEPCEVLSINSMEELGVVEDAMRTIREAKS